MMNLVRWNPWREMATLHNRFNRLMDDPYLRTDRESAEDMGTWYPVVDMFENDDSFVIKAELPGMGKDDIAVDVRSVSKKYRIYHEKIPSLKNTIIKGKRTTYEEFLALDDISLTISHGQTVGIIGPNGSGKSTLLKLISKIIQPNKGEIIVNGPLSALLELGAGFHPDLTGKENIYINATTVLTTDSVQVTCEVCCYSSGTEYAILYNSGSGWVNVEFGNCDGGSEAQTCTSVEQKTVNIDIADEPGTHYFRCWEAWDNCGSGTECCTDSYADHDDMSITVI